MQSIELQAPTYTPSLWTSRVRPKTHSGYRPPMKIIERIKIVHYEFPYPSSLERALDVVKGHTKISENYSNLGELLNLICEHDARASLTFT